MGFSVIGMTAMSEAYLCREAEICFASVALVTDTDVYGLMPVTAERVVKSMKENVKNVNTLLFEAFANTPEERSCPCATSMDVSLY